MQMRTSCRPWRSESRQVHVALDAEGRVNDGALDAEGRVNDGLAATAAGSEMEELKRGGVVVDTARSPVRRLGLWPREGVVMHDTVEMVPGAKETGRHVGGID
ncbi:hypothetical protein NOR_00819 [Metarhizium rileyi]|uniref:Uncharacterized protein n=1 Tax=Metarhizium rileyi (strain RCEF 4871) TaxID=1649241 RepID=A0A167JJG8_METRR|nr:hypothetical protein NOR_00819 [Metarhizium rileyi RCEF 4871]